MDNLLIATVGLPRSGKTTLCRLVSDRKGWAIVSPDAFRVAIHGKRFDPDREPEVWSAVRVTIDSLFLAGTSRILFDACNTSRKRRDGLRCNPAVVAYELAFHDMMVPAVTCAGRAEWDEDGEILPVIARMASEFEPLVGVERVYDLYRHA
jgi:predicted kinase